MLQFGTSVWWTNLACWHVMIVKLVGKHCVSICMVLFAHIALSHLVHA